MVAVASKVVSEVEAAKVVIVSGSWKSPSKTRQLVEAVAAELARKRPVSVARIDLAEVGLQIATLTTREGLPAATAILFETVEQADILIVGSPIYKASFTGLFKHLFDLIDPAALVGTPVVLTATGGSERHALALEHQFRPLFSFFNTVTLPTAVYAVDGDFRAGALVGRSVIERVERAAAEAVRELDRIRPLRAEQRQTLSSPKSLA